MWNTLIPVVLCVGLAIPPQGEKARAQALVKSAVAFARTQGKEALLRETNQGQGRFHTKDGDQIYLFVYDMEGVCLAIGYQTQLVGMNRLNARDPDGKPFIKDILEIARSRGSGWVDYKYPNPVTNLIETKSSYVEYMEGWVVGCGVYK